VVLVRPAEGRTLADLQRPMPAPPAAADAELVPALEDVVRQCREVWK
jgi:hypothetical protein